MAFPWLDCTPPRSDGEDRRVKAATSELASRAGALYRLGFTQADASHRLAAAIAWEYDSGQPSGKAGKHAFRRPAALSDQAISKIVADTFARRPG